MQIHEIGLPKKKLITEDCTYRLWESVGRKIVEAQLTPAQIQQVFQQVEQGATAAGGNRTAVGQVKDVGSAVNQAWEQLKSKVQNSGPIKNVDAAYDQAAEKLKQATGGDAGVMQYVEKYRAFAKAHPIAQSLIYAALIAAAGISGAGVGGAAALGLLKMTDKLLQGEKFSSAAYAGAKTGALAYGAGQFGKALQGKISDMPPDSAYNKPISSYSYDGPGIPTYHLPAEAYDYTPLPGGGYQFVANDNKLAQILSQELGRKVTPGEAQDLYIQLASQGRQQMGQMMNQGAAARGLRESQIRQAFYVAAGITAQLNEGVWDSIKAAAGKAAGAVANKAKTVGHNLTTVITVDKLMSAWRSAGSPTDSKAVAKVMRGVGVDDKIINKVISAVLSPAGTKPAPAKQAPINPKAPPTGGAGAFNQISQHVTAPTTPLATQPSSTGGTIQRTSTGLVHKANPNNPNMAYKESYVKYVDQLWGEYKLEENFMTDLAKAAGGAVKDTVGGAVQGVKDKAGQIGAQLKDPKAWVSTKAATAAKGGAQLAQQSAALVKQMAGEWPAVAKTITSKDAIANQPAKQPTAPNPGATTPKTPAPGGAGAFGQITKQLTDPSGAPANKPTPNIQGGSELQKAQAAGSPARLAVGDNRSELQIAAEPNSIANRQIDKEPTKVAVPGAPLGNEPVSIGGQKLNPKDPKQAALIAKAQAAANKPPVSEAFSDLPGAKPTAGGAVNPNVTKSVGKQGNPLTSAYITKFKQWSDGKLATRESNTGEEINMDVVKKEMPELDRALNTALTQVYATRQDPQANQQAVTAYLSQALSAIQKVATKKRQENPRSAARGSTKSVPGHMDTETEKMARSMNLSQVNLNKMKQVIDGLGEKVTSSTGSPTLDNLLVASGLLK